MPKLKTHRGAAKRLRKTGTGKIMRNKAFHSHLLAKKSAKRKRRLEGSVEIDPTCVRAAKRMLPYL